MYGWTGKILRVNLTDGTISKEPLPVKDAHEFIGPAGWGPRFSSMRLMLQLTP